MTDHEITDNELITLLNQCHDTESMVAFVIDSGNYRSEVVTLQRLIDLINRQKAEITRLITSNSQLEARVCADRTAIESLNAVHADMTESLRLAAEANKDMQAEIERFADIGKMYSEVRSEAIKEFAKRLKAKEAIHFCKCGQSFVYTDLFNSGIDSLVKEMTEVQNES